MAKQKNIIIRRKKYGNNLGYTKSGAWKVAYADFITAMMAFFLMLWLLSVTPEDTLKGIAEYFSTPTSNEEKVGTGVSGGVDKSDIKGVGASNPASSSLIYGSPSRGRKIQMDKGGMMTDSEKQHFMEIMSSIQKNSELQDYMDNISLDITNEGLRIQVMDSDNRPVFKPNTAELQPYMNKIITVLGKMIKSQPNYLAISGHTASIKDPNKNPSGDSWLLSAERANEIRKFLVKNEIQPDHIAKIIGKSDTEPFDIMDQYGVKNIRVSITLLNNASVSRFQQSAPTSGK